MQIVLVPSIVKCILIYFTACTNKLPVCLKFKIPDLVYFPFFKGAVGLRKSLTPRNETYGGIVGDIYKDQIPLASGIVNLIFT